MAKLPAIPGKALFGDFSAVPNSCHCSTFASKSIRVEVNAANFGISTAVCRCGIERRYWPGIAAKLPTRIACWHSSSAAWADEDERRGIEGLTLAAHFERHRLDRL